ncbi:hypothetical protein E2C01_040249 [Portunus trituberculatus]|uniref:Uncharacterized protein n=1 Tax=Portunus trituberculatus TaxID=210409 RepID=A0A5B7FMU3_PORTR|nr:hypothetical protein [Portunus trituberculatus]
MKSLLGVFKEGLERVERVADACSLLASAAAVSASYLSPGPRYLRHIPHRLTPVVLKIPGRYRSFAPVPPNRPFLNRYSAGCSRYPPCP